MRTKLVFTAHNSNSGMHLGYALQVAMEAWNACAMAGGLRIVQIALQPYMIYNNRTVMFEVIGSHDKRVCSAVAAQVLCSKQSG